MGTHHHQDPSAGRASLGETGDGIVEGPQRQLIAAGSTRLRDPEKPGIDHSSHTFGHYLSGVVAFSSMLGKLRSDHSDATHDLDVVDLRTGTFRQDRFSTTSDISFAAHDYTAIPPA